MPRSRNPDGKPKAQRQFGAALEAISGVQAQAQPMKDLQFKRQGQSNDPSEAGGSGRGRRRGHARGRSQSPGRDSSRGASHRQERGDVKDARQRERTPLQDRITRVERPQHQQARGSQTPREPVNTTRKRGRTDGSEQPPNKKARITKETNHTSTPAEERKEAVHQDAMEDVTQKKNPNGMLVTKLSEEEKKAARAKRFGKSKIAAETAHIAKDAGRHASTEESKNGSKAMSFGDPNKSSAEAHAAKNHGVNAETEPKEARIQPVVTSATAKLDSPDESTETDRKHISPPPPNLPSPSSSKGSSPTAKRPRAEADSFEEHSRKKPRLETDHSHLQSTPAQADLKPALKKSKKDPHPNTELPPPQQGGGMPRNKLQKPRVIMQDIRETPVEPNPEYVLNFFDYGDDSVPILYSASIQHYNDPAELDTKPSILLRQGALSLFRRGLTSNDLGRKEVSKSETTRIIDDCDLYFRDGKVHVATERGLLLAADYLKLIGVPDTQPIRFDGRRPAWPKLVEAKLHFRRVEETFIPSDAAKAQGLLEVHSGSTVVVYEIGVYDRVDDEDVVLAYGMRLDDQVKGWFPYEQTGRMDWGRDIQPGSETANVADPDIIDWSKFDYAHLAKVAAAAPPVTPAALNIYSTTQTSGVPATPAPALPTSALPAPTPPASTPAKAPGKSVDVSQEMSVADVSSVTTPQHKDTKPNETGVEVPVEVVPLKLDGRTPEAQIARLNDSREEVAPIEQMMTVAAGIMGTPVDEEDSAPNETAVGPHAQESVKEDLSHADKEQYVPKGIIEGPGVQEPLKVDGSLAEKSAEGPRHDSQQPSEAEKAVESVEKNMKISEDKTVVRKETTAEDETTVERIAPPPRKTHSPSRIDRSIEDLVDYDDGPID